MDPADHAKNTSLSQVCTLQCLAAGSLQPHASPTSLKACPPRARIRQTITTYAVQLCHRMKGASANLRLVQLRALFADLEAMFKSSTTEEHAGVPCVVPDNETTHYSHTARQAPHHSTISSHPSQHTPYALTAECAPLHAHALHGAGRSVALAALLRIPGPASACTLAGYGAAFGEKIDLLRQALKTIEQV